MKRIIENFKTMLAIRELEKTCKKVAPVIQGSNLQKANRILNKIKK